MCLKCPLLPMGIAALRISIKITIGMTALTASQSACVCVQQDEQNDSMKKRKSNDGSSNASKKHKEKVRSSEDALEGFGLGPCHFVSDS